MKKKPLVFTKHDPRTDEIRLDLGTGTGIHKPDGFIGVDLVPHRAVDRVVDMRKPWPWKSESVAEANCHYVMHYFTAAERVHVVNELWRVLKPGAKTVIVTPHEFASKAYGDLRVQWPPVAEAWYLTLNKAFRESEPYLKTCGYACDFDFTLGYGLHPGLVSRNQEYQQHAVTFWKEAAQDLCVTLVKRP